ncbi:hypothetical protein RHMOL_Rhmol01G0275200 [Rhododendron molle]|uniref:Uncharacterized protein n=1 Tax=Rhododendron molle TaxID=49168 RepID=A0ACC0Q7G5_RHOML|nr:hypothetical protein RHMOL_Rhmol01G0275200 [Rhododendron molle]
MRWVGGGGGRSLVDDGGGAVAGGGCGRSVAAGGGHGGVRWGRVGWDGDGRFLGIGFLGLGFWPNRCFGLVPLGVWALAI